ELPFEPNTQFFACLGEAGSEEADSRHFVSNAILQDSRRDLAWHRAYSVIDRFRDFGQRFVVRNPHRLDTGYFIRVDLHRIQLTTKALHGPQPHVAAHPLVADHGNSPCLEAASQVAPSLLTFGIRPVT